MDSFGEVESGMHGHAPPARPLLPARILHRIEDGIVIFSLAMMVLLPLAEIILRKLIDWKVIPHGMEGGAVFVQKGGLVVGLIGAAIAARENRLLSLATASMFRQGWPRAISRIVAASIGGAIAALLCLASTEFFRTVQFPTGKVIAYGVWPWMFEIALPIGFGLMTLSILYHSADRWKWRWIAPVIAAGLIALAVWLPIDPARLVVPAFVLLAIGTIMGSPLFAVLGGSALILFWSEGISITAIPLSHCSLADKPTLPAIPLFTLAGYFLAEGGASKRLVRVFLALFGSIKGGPAIVTALVCAFFTSFTGASGVTILALGGVVMPILVSARYSERSALGLLTGAGSLGMLFPPCLPLILYPIIANQVSQNAGVGKGSIEITDMFLGALIPGLLLVIMTAILGVWLGARSPSPGTPGEGRGEGLPRFSASEAVRALWDAKWELLTPVIPIVCMFAGLATAVEAAAMTALYAFFTQTIVWRDLSFTRGVPRAMVECGLVIGGVLLILGVAQGFTDYLIDAQIPSAAADWVTTSVKSPYVFLLLLNIFLLIVGGLMDIYPAIVVIVPLIVPIGQKFGINPIHLGVIFLANLEMGFLMPPVGLNLLLSSYRFKKPITEVYRSVIPILVVQFIAVLLITYIPSLTTFLPQRFGK